MRLPNEILLKILSFLCSEDLLSLAVASRYLNDISLSVYFSRHNLPEYPSTVSDDNLPAVLSALPGLSICLFTRSFELISVTLDYDCTWELKKLVSSVDHIDEVRFKLVDPYRLAERHQWQQSFGQLLQLTVGRCRKLTVSGESILQGGGQSLSILQSGGSLLPTPETKSRHMLKRGLDALLGRSKHSSSPQDDEPNQHVAVTGEMSEFYIHSPMLLQAPFLDWTVYAIKSCPVTSLSLQLEGISSAEWTSLLHTLDMPHLLYLSIASQNIYLNDVWSFADRHPSITHLRLRLPIDSQSTKQPQIRRSCLPNLETLNIYPNLASSCITRENSFPRLRRVSFAARFDEDSSSAYEFVEALSRIARRSNSIELKLELWGIDAHKWIDAHSSANASEGKDLLGLVLPGVERLDVWILSIPLENNLLYSLPKWLAFTFPALWTLSIYLPLIITDEMRREFMKLVGDSLPEIEIVEMKDGFCDWGRTVDWDA